MVPYQFLGLLSFICICVISCSTPPQSSEKSFEVLQWDTLSLPPNILERVVDSSTLNLAYWQDKNGANYFEVGQQITESHLQLFAYHYIQVGEDSLRLNQQFKEFVTDCDYDPILQYIPASLTITDMDSNQIGEVVFLYQKGCISDLSPLDARLFLVEGNGQYLIRGTTEVRMGDTTLAGQQEIDPAFNDLPIVLQSYARAQWSRFTDTTVYY